MYLNSHKKKLNESVAGIAAVLGAGTLIGGIINQLYNDYQKRKMSCEYVTNPILQDKCRVKILDSLIDNLKNARMECEQTPDPAKCHLALMRKIDKVTEQKLKLLSQINYIQKSKAIDKEQI